MIETKTDGTYEVKVQGNVPCRTDDGKTWVLNFSREQLKVLVHEGGAHLGMEAATQ